MKNILSTITLAIMLVGTANANIRNHKKYHNPAFSAKSYLVANSDGEILKEKKGAVVRPIASITKLMIAVLVSEQDGTEVIDIPIKRQLHSKIPAGVTELTRKELLTLALVKSDNFSAQLLCSNLPNCLNKMNEKAKELGMKDTHYTEPTGLDIGNVSTAYDLLKLLMYAGTIPVITELSSLPTADILSEDTHIKIHNTNRLISKFNFVLSKTGFTNPAGGCLVMIVKLPVGQRIFVLLGSKNAKTRFPDMEKLIREL